MATRDLNDARQNAKLKQLEVAADREDDDCMTRLMGDSDGRRVICKLARELGWMGNIWDEGSSRKTDYNAGRVSGATTLMGWAERVAPEQFLVAIGEATRRANDRALLAEAAITPPKTGDDEDDDPPQPPGETNG